MVATDSDVIGGAKLTLTIARCVPRFTPEAAAALAAAVSGSAASVATVQQALVSRDFASLAAAASKAAAVALTVEGAPLSLLPGTHFFASPGSALAASHALRSQWAEQGGHTAGALAESYAAAAAGEAQ